MMTFLSDSSVSPKWLLNNPIRLRARLNGVHIMTRPNLVRTVALLLSSEGKEYILYLSQEPLPDGVESVTIEVEEG
jgi:hypothetical protein